MGEVFIWRLFNQVAIGPHVWGVASDAKLLERKLTEEVPHVLDYLERELPSTGLLFATLSVADIAIAAFFRNALFARLKVDQRRWPITARYVDRVLALPSFGKLAAFEDQSLQRSATALGKWLRTPWRDHRAALTEMGAPLTPTTFATTEPRRGMMQI